MVKFLLWALVLILCWPLALLVAGVWIPYKLFVVTGKVSAKSVKWTALGAGALTSGVKPKPGWHSPSTPVGLLEKRKSA